MLTVIQNLKTLICDGFAPGFCNSVTLAALWSINIETAMTNLERCREIK
jgi:hypothetical protein